MWLLATLSLPHLRRHAARTALSVFGIVLGIATMVATTAATDAIVEAFRRSLHATAGRTQLQVANGGAGVPQALVQELAALPDVAAVAPVVQGFVSLGGDDGDMLAVFGIPLLEDTEREVQLPRAALDVPDGFALVARLDSVVVARSFAAKRGLAIGSPLAVVGPARPHDADGPRSGRRRRAGGALRRDGGVDGSSSRAAPPRPRGVGRPDRRPGGQREKPRGRVPVPGDWPSIADATAGRAPRSPTASSARSVPSASRTVPITTRTNVRRRDAADRHRARARDRRADPRRRAHRQPGLRPRRRDPGAPETRGEDEMPVAVRSGAEVVRDEDDGRVVDTITGARTTAVDGSPTRH